MNQQIQQKNEDYKTLSERERNLQKELEAMRNEKVGSYLLTLDTANTNYIFAELQNICSIIF